MRSTKIIPALAGLVLALVLAATAAGSSDADADSADAGALSPEATAVVAAAVANTPAVTVPLADPAVPTTTPGPTDAEIIEFAAAVEAAEVEEAARVAAEQAAREAAARQDAATANAAPGSVEEIIARHFGPHTSKAMSVARCESGLNPSAMSPGGGNHGLFQINNVHRGKWSSVTGTDWSARYDAETNTRFAKWLFDQSGWGPWACA